MTKDLTLSGHPKPYLQWSGSKRLLAPVIVDLLASAMGLRSTYYEPFAGSGAVYLRLQWLNSVGAVDGWKASYLSDICDRLITTHQAIAETPDRVVEYLRSLEGRTDRLVFDSVREALNTRYLSDPPYITAARFVYVNRVGYNGLWRVNGKGQCNVPYGRPSANGIGTAVAKIRESALFFARARFRCDSYVAALADVKKGDVVYLDPPYDKTHTYGQRFGPSEQMDLAEFCRGLDLIGVKFVASNADTEFVRSLYQRFQISSVKVRRTISCKGDGRKPGHEVIITNIRR